MQWACIRNTQRHTLQFVPFSFPHLLVVFFLLFTYLDLVEGSYFWLSYRVIVLTSPNGKPREFFFLIVCTRLFSKAVLHFRESGLLKHETQHRCKINKIQLLGRSVYPHMQMNLLSTSVLTTCPLILPAG